MSIDKDILLYSLANTCDTVLHIKICKHTKEFINSKKNDFMDLDSEEKLYYSNYAIKLAKELVNYLEKVVLFEIRCDEENEIDYDFKLSLQNKDIVPISMSHLNVNIRNLIPEKLMKFCKYSKRTKVCKHYISEYNKICEECYEEIKSETRYNNLEEKTKIEFIFDPVCELIMESISKKRKCSIHLYNHLFDEEDRIVLKLYKNKFIIYDFGIELETVESHKMIFEKPNTILIEFNNGTKFKLVLFTNSNEIKQHISLKFHTRFMNMDKIFAVSQINL